MNKPLNIALVDDHVLLRTGLASLVESFGYTVSLQCSDGKELINKLDKNNLPDLILMDINMPRMNGFEATGWLQNNYPFVNVIALSMYDDENAIIKMIRHGARGYILKDANPEELKRAIESVITKGFHYSDLVTGKVIHTILKKDKNENTDNLADLNEKETEFLKYACTEMTYKEIASKVNLSPRTIDGYRDQLFVKLHVKSRVGLVMFAIKNGIVRFDKVATDI